MALLEVPPNTSELAARPLKIYSLVRKIELASRNDPAGELSGSFYQTATHGLVQFAGIADDARESHVRRVADISYRIARAIGWTEHHAETLRVAAALHDIGKVGVPAQILYKPVELNDRERTVLRKHTWLGYRLFGRAQFPILKMARVISLAHHERWDGGGYPRGIKDVKIPEAARIVALADTYDTLLSPRPFRDPFPSAEALDRMDRIRKQAFDPEMWPEFLRVRDEETQAGA